MGARLTPMKIWIALLIVAAAPCAGCQRSPYEIVPVSGQIRLNGEPLPDARLGFEPVSDGRGIVVGPASYAKTDEQGRFTLVTARSQRGAVAGKHQVWVRTFQGAELPGGKSQVIRRELLPDRYHSPTALTFDVPPDGTAQADFDLTAP
jgi:hypothetical protein